MVWLGQWPEYLLPSPSLVARSFYRHAHYLGEAATITAFEAIVGFSLAFVLACFFAVIASQSRSADNVVRPFLLVHQAVPSFVLAPVFVIWLGYGFASKILLAALGSFFPIFSAFLDGLQKTPEEWIFLAKSCRASSWQTLRWLRIPAALPSLASGLRIAASVAPMGAVVGEWVGSEHGLGYVMLNAHARLQIDLMFAAVVWMIF